MLLGGFGPDSVFKLTTAPGTADVLLRIQLVMSSALALAGIGVLVVRRRGAGRPLRRWVALLTDSFAGGLLMIAVLAMRAAVGAPGYVTIQRVTYFVVGLAAFAFLIGLLDARLARSTVGDLFVELRADPAPADLRDALACALRDPSLTLAYWLPEFGSWTDLAGQRERQRLERDLHDGAQQRLIALSLELGLLEGRFDSEAETRTRVNRARQEIATSNLAAAWDRIHALHIT